MDPVQQTLAQQESGSARGEGFGQYFIQGRQQNLQQQQLNLSGQRLQLEKSQEKRHQTRQSLLLPLEQAVMTAQISQLGQQFVSNQQKIQHEAYTNDYAIKAQQADLAVANLMTQLVQSNSWGTPEALTAFNEIVKTVPLAAVSRSGQMFMQQQMIAKRFNELNDLHGKPVQATVPLQGGGEAIFGELRSGGQVNSELERRVREWETRTGKKMSTEQYNDLFEIATGQRAREGVQHPLTLQEYIDKHIDKAMDQTSVPAVDEKTGKPNGRFRTPRSRDEAISVLTQEFNKGQAVAPTPAAPASNARVRVISPDGKPFTLPASQLEAAKQQGYREPKQGE